MLTRGHTRQGAARQCAALLALTAVFSGGAAAQYWTPIDTLFSRLTSGTIMDPVKYQVSIASDGTLLAVDMKFQPWQWNRTDSKWVTFTDTKLRQVSAASKNEIWGLTSSGKVLRYTPATSWTEIPAPSGVSQMNWVSAASDGTVIGTGTLASTGVTTIYTTPEYTKRDGPVYRYNATSKSWSPLPGQLSQLAAGSANIIWGVDSKDGIWRLDSATSTWKQAPGALVNIAASGDGEVWGTSKDATLWRWNGSQWDRKQGKLKDISVGGVNVLAGLTNDLPLPIGNQPPPPGTPPTHHTVIGSYNPDFCWKSTTTRGVGTIPAGCSLDQQKRGLLCYPACKSGYTAFVATCSQDCPAGFRNDGLFCAKPAAYGRGGGYPWQFGDALNNDGMMARCRAGSGTPCEMNGAIAYPTCKAGFSPVGANICSPICPAGMTDAGVSCTKQTYTQAASTLQCAAGQVNDAGLCYPSCPVSSTGAGPVCWGACKGDTPFACAAGCARNQTSCGQHTADIVISSVSSVISIVSMIVAPGAGDVVNAAMREGLKQFALTLGKYLVPKLTDAAIKESILLMSELSGVSVSGTAANNWSTFLMTIQDAGAKDATTAYQVIDSMPIDPILLDITGLSKVVMSLTNPVCK